MGEVWKKIDTLYRMDSRSNIIAKTTIKDGYYISSGGRLKVNGVIRHNLPDKSSGYICDCLQDNHGKRVRFKRHQIVLQTFSMDDYRPGMTVDHRDRDKNNNSLLNLRWATKNTQVRNRENKAYKYKRIRCKNDGLIFNSCQEAETYYGLPKNMVSRVARGERHTVHGYGFEYVA